jgi:DNA polymerase-3 subunit beta
MNFRINKLRFYEALTIAARALSPNSPVPALSGIKIDVSQDSIILTGSDAHISIQVILNNASDDALGLSITEPGTIVIDSRYLLEIVKKIDSSDIHIEIIDGTLTHFTGQKAEFRINGYRPSEYPVIDFSEPAVRFSIAPKLLNEVMSAASFAVSNKDTRPVLTGINMKSEKGTLICTGTDSFRLARKTAKVDCPAFSVTVPARTMNEAKGIFANESSISVSLSDKKIQFRSTSVIMQSTLLEGNYPDTDRLIPTVFNNTLVINRGSFLSSIDRTSFIKTDNMSIIRLQVSSADDITISAKSPEIGEYNEDLTAISYEGIPVDISFSGGYMMDALKSLSTDNVIIRFTENMKPFVINNEGEDQSVLQLILPVRTYN